MLSFKNRENRSTKAINQSQILQAIKIHDLISRIELSRITDLDPSTVSRAVRKLQDLGLIKEHRTGKSTGGRRPVMLGLNDEEHHIVGIDIGATKIKGVVTNLLGEVEEEITQKIEHAEGKYVDISPQSVLRTIDSLLKNYCQNNSGQENILGIGIGVHGLVDKEKGISIFAPNFGWENVELQNIVEEKFDLRTYIDNDVRVMALGEYWFGHGRGVDNLLCVNAGYGVGSGIILSGEVYRGHKSLAGEIGHTTVEEDGPLCNCGDYGCLETLASGPAIAREVRKYIKRGFDSNINNMVGRELDKITGKIVGEAAKKGDELSRQILKQAGNYLGIGISNLVNVLDPEIVLIGGGVSKSGDLILSSLKKTVKTKSMFDPPPIKTTKLRDKAGPIGGGVLVMEALYSSPEKFFRE